MSPFALSNLFALALSAGLVAAQAPTATYPATALASKGPFAYPSGIVSLDSFAPSAPLRVSVVLG